MLKRSQAIALIVLGVIKIVFGATILFLAFVAASSSSGVSGGTRSIIITVLVGIGIIIPGIFGIVAGVKKTPNLVRAYMNFCIFISIFVGIGLILGIVQYAKAAKFLVNRKDHCYTYESESRYRSSKCICNFDGTKIELKDSCKVLDSAKGVIIFVTVFYSAIVALILGSTIFSCYLVCSKTMEMETGRVIEPPVQPPIVQFENIHPHVVYIPEENEKMQGKF